MMVIQSLHSVDVAAETGTQETFEGVDVPTSSVRLQGSAQRAVDDGVPVTITAVEQANANSNTYTALTGFSTSPDEDGVVTFRGIARARAPSGTGHLGFNLNSPSTGIVTTQFIDLIAITTTAFPTSRKIEAARSGLRYGTQPFNIGSIFIQTPGGTNTSRNLRNDEFTVEIGGDLTNPTARIIFTPELNADAFPLTLNLAIDAYDTAGVPNDNSKVRVTYNIAAHTEDRHDIYPADRCRWQQDVSNDGNGYSIFNAEFYPGNAAATAIPNARLGFIGKSGRFVPITDKI